jgi:preprotein translocase subunit SecF
MRILHDTKIDFLGKRKIFYIVSVTVIVIGMIILYLKPIPLGIDFLGGTELQVKFSNMVDIGDVRTAMDKSDLTGMEIKSMGSGKDVLLRTPLQEEGQTVSDNIIKALKTNFPDNTFSVERIDKVGPKIGSELRTKALFAVVFSLLGILIYLAFRFQFIYAFGAVVALFHDVLITVSVVAICDFLIPSLKLELNQTMLAAFLTLIGFSVNDTVIIFDRIRENIKLYKNENIESVMNKSVNATLSRTIITSGTVFLTVLVLFLFGGEVLAGFSFTFGIGIITGTYSSVFVASSIVVDWKSRIHKATTALKSKAKLSPAK